MRLQLGRLRLEGAAAVSALLLFAPVPAAAQGPWHVSADTLVYDDTDNVTVVSPQAAVRYDLDEEGGAVGVRAAVDVVSAASVDVVSQATTRFSEVRTDLNLSVAKAFGDHLPGASYRFSIEPDYVSHGASAALRSRLGTPDSVLSLAYSATFDTVGMSGTPTENFSESLVTHGADIGLTQILGQRTVLRGVYTLTVQNGYMEKPYRFVPLFDQAGVDRARTDGNHLDLDSFDRYRLDARPPESVPDVRVGHAFAIRGIQYLDAVHGSVRLDYQLYLDSFGLWAHVVEPVCSIRVADGWLLSSYGRFYWQSSASFWRRQYVVSAPDRVPRWRTADRDLSGYHAVSGGVRVELELGDHFHAYADGSIMATTFRDFLFLDHRLALMALTGVRWNP